MRNRKPIATKVASATSTGVDIINKQPSTYSRVMNAVRQLGIDAETYKQQASLRMYNRMSQHQYLGINS